MAKKKITETVEEVLQDFLAENCYELYNVEFIKEGKDWILRVYIDKADGICRQESQESDDKDQGDSRYIGVDDCEKVSRFLSEELDARDPIEQNYYLEVSSPGMDRALLRKKDFEKYAGSQVELSLYKSVNGRKNISGRLVGLIDGNVVIVDEKDNRIEMPIDQVAKTKLAVIF